jgi:alpha-beta hydrolase superfamily lysophospholipase
MEKEPVMKKWKGDVVFLILVGALIGGWLYLYPAPRDSLLSPLEIPADLETSDLPSYAATDGTKLTYRLFEPQGEVRQVVVFLHDTLLHSAWYARLGSDLAAQGVAVYLPDRRGWGHSEGDRRQVSEDRDILTEDIAAMISVAQDRYPQHKIWLGGHGRGAGLVLRYVATQRPVPGVILVSPYLTDEQLNLRPEGWQSFISAHPGEAFLARSGLVYWRVWHYNWPAEMCDADPLLETRCSISLEQEALPDDADAAMGLVTVPLLYVQGGDDPLFDTDRTAELMTRFGTSDRQLETLPGTDYLTVIDAAAGPIATWLAGR